MSSLGSPKVGKTNNSSNTGQTVQMDNKPRLSGSRVALILVLVGAKLAYIAWFYTSGIGLNLGDTAAYIDRSNTSVFFERGGEFGFAYLVTLLFSNPAIRILVELATLMLSVWLIARIDKDRQAFLATLVLVLPTNLAFMTVASKELVVFVLLVAAMLGSTRYSLVSYFVLLFLKPTFVLVAIMAVLRRAGWLVLHFSTLFITSTFLLLWVLIERFYEDSFYEYWPHFRDGDLTYSEPGVFPIAPLLRTVGIQWEDFTAGSLVLSASIMVSSFAMLLVLRRIHGAFRGSLQYALLVLAVLPYSIFNLGSAARYQAPLLCAVILCELVKSGASNSGRVAMNPRPHERTYYSKA